MGWSRRPRNLPFGGAESGRRRRQCPRLGSLGRTRIAGPPPLRTVPCSPWRPMGRRGHSWGAFLVGRRVSDPLKVKRNEIRGFLLHIKDRGLKPASLNNRWRGLHAIYEWLVAEGELEMSPLYGLRPRSVPEEPTPLVNESVLKQLLEAAKGRDFRGPPRPCHHLHVRGADLSRQWPASGPNSGASIPSGSEREGS
jgi:hypothetical protein